MSDPIGSTWGVYRIDGVIGTGGFATVYGATDTRFGDTVAVKVLAENHSRNPEIRARFLGEAHALRRIRSDAVVRVTDVGETDSHQPYFVLDLAEGGDLGRRVEAWRSEGHVVSAADVAAVADVLGEALSAIHAEDVVHRDLTPSNVLIRRVTTPHDTSASFVAATERLVVADLGHAKDLAMHSGLTVGGGTIGFNAPEQRLGVSMVSPKADLYAATAVLVWLISGRAPGLMDPDDVEALIRESGFGPEVIAEVRIGLALEPKERHADAQSWRLAFRSALLASSDVMALTSETLAAASPQARWGWTRWVPAAVAVVAASVVGWMVMADGSPCSADDDGFTSCVVSLDSGDVTMRLPTRIRVGDTAVVAVEGTAGMSWTVYGPNGGEYPGVASLELVPATAGPGHVTLLVEQQGDEPSVLRHDFEVAP